MFTWSYWLYSFYGLDTKFVKQGQPVHRSKAAYKQAAKIEPDNLKNGQLVTIIEMDLDSRRNSEL